MEFACAQKMSWLFAVGDLYLVFYHLTGGKNHSQLKSKSSDDSTKYFISKMAKYQESMFGLIPCSRSASEKELLVFELDLLTRKEPLFATSESLPSR
jgi:hypothetical protein